MGVPTRDKTYIADTCRTVPVRNEDTHSSTEQPACLRRQAHHLGHLEFNFIEAVRSCPAAGFRSSSMTAIVPIHCENCK